MFTGWRFKIDQFLYTIQLKHNLKNYKWSNNIILTTDRELLDKINFVKNMTNSQSNNIDCCKIKGDQHQESVIEVNNKFLLKLESKSSKIKKRAKRKFTQQQKIANLVHEKSSTQNNLIENETRPNLAANEVSFWSTGAQSQVQTQSFAITPYANISYQINTNDGLDSSSNTNHAITYPINNNCSYFSLLSMPSINVSMMHNHHHEIGTGLYVEATTNVDDLLSEDLRLNAHNQHSQVINNQNLVNFSTINLLDQSVLTPSNDLSTPNGVSANYFLFK